MVVRPGHYETLDGIADFQATGRHTLITELLRNGVSLPVVKGLARHTDVKMTIRYAHIGIADQEAAVSNLHVPKLIFEPVADATKKELGSVLAAHQMTQSDFPALAD